MTVGEADGLKMRGVEENAVCGLRSACRLVLDILVLVVEERVLVGVIGLRGAGSSGGREEMCLGGVYGAEPIPWSSHGGMNCGVVVNACPVGE